MNLEENIPVFANIEQKYFLSGPYNFGGLLILDV